MLKSLSLIFLMFCVSLKADEPIQQGEDLECYYVHSDRLQSAKVLTNEEGLKQHYEYKAFGGERFVFDTENFVSSRRFTDQVYDEDTGLYHYGARYYDPLIGRFLQADPVIADPKNPQDLNSYTYVRNNPLRYEDPSGKTPQRPFYENTGYGFWTKVAVGLGNVGYDLKNFADHADATISGLSSGVSPFGVDVLDIPLPNNISTRETLASVSELPRDLGKLLDSGEKFDAMARFRVATMVVGGGVTAGMATRTAVRGGKHVVTKMLSAGQSAKATIRRWFNKFSGRNKRRVKEMLEDADGQPRTAKQIEDDLARQFDDEADDIDIDELPVTEKEFREMGAEMDRMLEIDKALSENPDAAKNLMDAIRKMRRNEDVD